MNCNDYVPVTEVNPCTEETLTECQCRLDSLIDRYYEVMLSGAPKSVRIGDGMATEQTDFYNVDMKRIFAMIRNLHSTCPTDKSKCLIDDNNRALSLKVSHDSKGHTCCG